MFLGFLIDHHKSVLTLIYSNHQTAVHWRQIIERRLIDSDTNNFVTNKSSYSDDYHSSDNDNNNYNDNNNNDNNNNSNNNNSNNNNNRINNDNRINNVKYCNEILTLPTSGLNTHEIEKIKIEIARTISSVVRT